MQRMHYRELGVQARVAGADVDGASTAVTQGGCWGERALGTRNPCEVLSMLSSSATLKELPTLVLPWSASQRDGQCYSRTVVGDRAGLSIAAKSLLVRFLVLTIYRRAKIQWFFSSCW